MSTKYERDDYSSAIFRYNRSASMTNSPKGSARQHRFQSVGSRPRTRFRALPDPIMEESPADLEMLEFPLPKHLWQSDNVRKCIVCRNQFRKFLGKSRHHCRICGKCVCGVCSIYRLREHRICKNCHSAPENENRFPELADKKSIQLDKLNSPMAVFNDVVQLSEPEDEADNEVFSKGTRTSVNSYQPESASKVNPIQSEILSQDGQNAYGANVSYSRDVSYPGMSCGAFSEGLPSPALQARTRDRASSDLFVSPAPQVNRDYASPAPPAERMFSEVNSVSSYGREKRDSLVQCSANLSQWKTRHCIRWLRSLRLGEKEEKAVDAILDLGLCGSDLQGISDRDLQVEMKIFSAILRRRILRNLQHLTQETADAIVKEDDTGDIPPLNDKDIVKLARKVEILEGGTFAAIDRIFILHSPSQFEVKWYPTNIRPGIHKVTVVDRKILPNSSYWIMRYEKPCLANGMEQPSLSTHCLSKNQNALRWRLHNGSVELCINSVSDELNTELVISLTTISLPQVSASSGNGTSTSSLPIPRRATMESLKLLSPS